MTLEKQTFDPRRRNVSTATPVSSTDGDSTDGTMTLRERVALIKAYADDYDVSVKLLNAACAQQRYFDFGVWRDIRHGNPVEWARLYIGQTKNHAMISFLTGHMENVHHVLDVLATSMYGFLPSYVDISNSTNTNGMQALEMLRKGKLDEHIKRHWTYLPQ